MSFKVAPATLLNLKNQKWVVCSVLNNMPAYSNSKINPQQRNHTMLVISMSKTLTFEN